jgi:hypothetical protein
VTIDGGTLRCDYRTATGFRCRSIYTGHDGAPRYTEAARDGWTISPTSTPPNYANDICPLHPHRLTESPVPDDKPASVTVDASRDLATIRLRTATGHLYDIDVEWLAQRLGGSQTFESTTKVAQVPTWEGVPIPSDLQLPNTMGLPYWKRGVTDANNATLNGEPK